MLLCIDCGNTNTVFSIWDGARFIATWRASTEHQRTADQYFVWLSTPDEPAEDRGERITEVIISSTVPRVVFNLRVLCNRYFDCRPLVVGKPECRCRWSRASIPARGRPGPAGQRRRRLRPVRRRPDRGRFRHRHHFRRGRQRRRLYRRRDRAGGEPVARGAAHGRRRAAACRCRRPERVIGKNTVECMQAGVFWGYVGLVNGICERIKAEHTPDAVIGTGGLGALVRLGRGAI
jgi:type III pantothenate kinase